MFLMDFRDMALIIPNRLPHDLPVVKYFEGAVTGTVILPPGLDGTFLWKGKRTPLSYGANAIGQN